MPKQFQVFQYKDVSDYLAHLSQDANYAPQNQFERGKKVKQLQEEILSKPQSEWNAADWLAAYDRAANSDPAKGILGKANTYDWRGYSDKALNTNGYPFEVRKMGKSMLEGKEEQLGPYRGADSLWIMLSTVREEKWKEMPEFAAVVVRLFHKLNLPLPVPRVPMETCAEIRERLDREIAGEDPTPENLNAMLGILAAEAPQDKKEYYIPYGQHSDFEKKDPWREMYGYVHPIVQTARMYELSRDAALMERLNTPEAVRAAREGRLNEFARRSAEAGKAPEKEEAEERIEWKPRRTPVRLAADRSRKTRDAYENLFRNEGVDDEFDVSVELPTSAVYGSSYEYTMMLQAGYNIVEKGNSFTEQDLERAKRACLDYIKGKEKVRFTERGREHFNFALKILHAVSAPDDPEVKAAVDKINRTRGVANKPNHKNFVDLDNYGLERMELEPFGWEHEEELKQQLKDCAARLKGKSAPEEAQRLQKEQQSRAMQLMVLRATTAPNQIADVEQIEELANKLVKNQELTDFLNNDPDISKSASLQQRVVAGFIWSGGKLPTLVEGNQKEIETAVKENKQKIVANPAGWSL